MAQAADEVKIKKIAIDYLKAQAINDFTKLRTLVHENSYKRLDEMKEAWQKRPAEKRLKESAYLQSKIFKAGVVIYKTGRRDEKLAFVEVEFVDKTKDPKKISITKTVSEICVTNASGKWLVDLNEELELTPSIGR